MSLGQPGATATLSGTSSRELITDALATVPGLSVTPSVPDVPTPGAAWPVWVQTTYAAVLAAPARDTYDVYVLLAGGLSEATVMEGKAQLAQVVRALWLPCVVELAEPVAVRFDSQTQMPGLRIRVTMRGSNSDA